MREFRWAVAAVALLTLSAGADVIFEQAPVDGAGAGISDTGIAQFCFDDFTLAPSANVVAGVHWWGAYGTSPDPAIDDFVLSFFDALEGSTIATYSAGAVSRIGTALTASQFGGHDGGTVYEYSYYLPSALVLTAGETYYISIVNSTSSYWGWMESGAGSHWYGFGGDWYETLRGTNLAFRLTGPVVPEPTTLSLLALGLSGLGLRRLRRVFNKKPA